MKDKKIISKLFKSFFVVLMLFVSVQAALAADFSVDNFRNFNNTATDYVFEAKVGGTGSYNYTLLFGDNTNDTGTLSSSYNYFNKNYTGVFGPVNVSFSLGSDDNNLNNNANIEFCIAGVEIPNNGIDEDCSGQDLIIQSSMKITLNSPILTNNQFCGWKWINSTTETNDSYCNVKGNVNLWDININTNETAEACWYEFGITDMKNYYKYRLNLTPSFIPVSNGTLNKISGTEFSKSNIDPINEHNYLKISCNDSQGLISEIIEHVELDFTSPGKIIDLNITPIVYFNDKYHFNLSFTLPGDDDFNNLSPLSYMAIYKSNQTINSSNYMDATYIDQSKTNCYEEYYYKNHIPGDNIVCQVEGKDIYYENITISWEKNNIHYAIITYDNIYNSNLSNSVNEKNIIYDCAVTSKRFWRENPEYYGFITNYSQNFNKGDLAHISFEIKNLGDGEGCTLNITDDSSAYPPNINPFGNIFQQYNLTFNNSIWFNYSWNITSNNDVESYGADIDVSSLELIDWLNGEDTDFNSLNGILDYSAFSINYTKYLFEIYANDVSAPYANRPNHISFNFRINLTGTIQNDILNNYNARSKAGFYWMPITINLTAKQFPFLNPPVYSHGEYIGNSVEWNPSPTVHSDMYQDITIIQNGTEGYSTMPYSARYSEDYFNFFIEDQDGGAYYTYKLCAGYFIDQQVCSPEVTMIFT